MNLVYLGIEPKTELLSGNLPNDAAGPELRHRRRREQQLGQEVVQDLISNFDLKKKDYGQKLRVVYVKKVSYVSSKHQGSIV